jgi:phenylacetate-coenzyme A ligase PaaK-like adenylate-forming protein
VKRHAELRTLSVEIEPAAGGTDGTALAAAVGRRLREALGLSVPVTLVPPQSLPRFEMKAHRFVVEEERR